MSDKVVAVRDGAETSVALETWFGSRGVVHPKVRTLAGPEATGYSHETIVFELAHDDGIERFVARVEPRDVSVFPDPDLSVEYRLLDAIADAGVPLPKLHGFESDPQPLGAPFYVMECLDGEVPGDSPPYTMIGWMHEAAPELRERVWWSGVEAMARAHTIDWEARDLHFVNGGRPLGLAGELEYWERYIDFCAAPIAPVATRAWNHLRTNAPADTHIALCWGDSRLGNQMFRDGDCVALLDWEMACLSDPVQDLAWFMHFDELFGEGLGVPKLDGIPSRDETVARYEEVTGQHVENISYFAIFAAFRFVVILQRLGNLQIAAGKLPPDSTFPTDNFATEHLARLCDEKGVS